MAAREEIYRRLSTDAQLQSLGFLEVYNIEAVDNPDRAKPFLVTAWGSTPPNPWPGRARRIDLLVWAHDDSADYTKIDAALARVYSLLVDPVHQGGISQVSWTGDSPDLYDDGFRTITRNSGFRVNERISA